MKKNLFFAAAALVALASCSENELVESNSPTPTQEGTEAITFGSGLKAVTRAEFTGEVAAELLNKKFVFAGTKLDKESTPANHWVHDQYYAEWVTNTANTTESNSNDWEYVGYTPYGVGISTISTLPSGATQTIKYWDYSTTQYDFAAYSLGKGVEVTPATDPKTYNYAEASGINKDTKTYTLTGTADQLKACYISDLVTAYNRDGAKDYGKVVNFSFRSLAAKIRLAFYETIPGYSVKNVEFYNKAEFSASSGSFGTTAAASTTPYLLNTNDAKTLPTGKGTMTISFPTTGWASRTATDYNKAHIAFAATNEDDDLSASLNMFGALADFATAREGVLDPSGNYLGRTSNTATYAGGLVEGSGKYYTILPNENPADLMIRIKYTLVATDGSDENIVVDNASAVIPKELAKWSPNYAYTYIFKISDLTNGSTGTDGSGNIVCGLTPITLNAVVVDSEDGVQETITTVSHPSITTYAEGKVVTENDEYVASTPIYIIVNDGLKNVDLSTTNAKLYTATVTSGAIQGITEETVDNALRYGVIDGGGVNPTTYTVTDAAGKSLVVTDITPNAEEWLVDRIIAADSPTGNEIIIGTNKAAKIASPTGSTVYVFQYLKNESSATTLVYTAVPVKTLTSGATYYTSDTGTGEFVSNGTEKVIAGGTAYYTKSVTYERVQSTSLTASHTYYTDSDGTGEFSATGSEDPKTTAYYEKVETYTQVPYKKLDAGTTYYTTNRGAGEFKAVGTEDVDADDKYFTFTSGTPAESQYKIIKVQ